MRESPVETPIRSALVPVGNQNRGRVKNDDSMHDFKECLAATAELLSLEIPQPSFAEYGTTTCLTHEFVNSVKNHDGVTQDQPDADKSEEVVPEGHLSSELHIGRVFAPGAVHTELLRVIETATVYIAPVQERENFRSHVGDPKFENVKRSDPEEALTSISQQEVKSASATFPTTFASGLDSSKQENTKFQVSPNTISPSQSGNNTHHLSSLLVEHQTLSTETENYQRELPGKSLTFLPHAFAGQIDVTAEKHEEKSDKYRHSVDVGADRQSEDIPLEMFDAVISKNESQQQSSWAGNIMANGQWKIESTLEHLLKGDLSDNGIGSTKSSVQTQISAAVRLSIGLENLQAPRNVTVLRIRLEPEELGEVEVHFRMTGQKIDIRIAAVREESFAVLTQYQTEIAEAIKEIGFESTSVQFEQKLEPRIDGQSLGSGQSNRGAFGGGDNGHRGSRFMNEGSTNGKGGNILDDTTVADNSNRPAINLQVQSGTRRGIFI